MSADNKRFRQWLGFPMIEAEREANKRRPVRKSGQEAGNHFADAGKMVGQSALQDGVVLQVKK